MNGWTILLVILLLIALLMLVRVGAEVSYGSEGLGVRIRLGQIRLTILPRPEKKQGAKPQKKKQSKEQKPASNESAPAAEKATESQSAPETKPAAEAGAGSAAPAAKPKEKTAEEAKQPDPPAEEKKKGGLPIPLMDLISIAIDAVGQVLSRLQIDILHVEYTIGGKTDPASAAISYGMLYAGGGTIVPLLENTFYRIEKREIHAEIDFGSDESLIYLCLAISIRIGQIFAIIGHLGWAFLKSFIKKQRTMKQEGKKNGTEASHQ